MEVPSIIAEKVLGTDVYNLFLNCPSFQAVYDTRNEVRRHETYSELDLMASIQSCIKSLGLRE